MCKRSEEFVDHFSLHCDVASTIWSAFFSHFGLSWVMPTHIVDRLFNCRWSSSRPKSVAVWKMVRTFFFWCVWKDMNDIYFEDRERSLGEILSLFYETLYLWMAAYVSSLSISYSAFLIRFTHAS
jgi:hypothetical protein